MTVLASAMSFPRKRGFVSFADNPVRNFVNGREISRSTLMRILLADAFPAPHLERLRSEGHECEFAPTLTGEDLPGVVSGFDVLVVRSTRVEAATLEAAESLRLVVRAGAGTNTIDTSRARELGVDVCNVRGGERPGGRRAHAGTESSRPIAGSRTTSRTCAAEHGTRRATPGHADCSGARSASWERGAIGMAVAERAAAFGMRIQGDRESSARRRRPRTTRCRRSGGAAFARGARRAERLPLAARPGRRADERTRQSRHPGPHAPWCRPRQHVALGRGRRALG